MLDLSPIYVGDKSGASDLAVRTFYITEPMSADMAPTTSSLNPAAPNFVPPERPTINGQHTARHSPTQQQIGSRIIDQQPFTDQFARIDQLRLQISQQGPVLRTTPPALSTSTANNINPSHTQISSNTYPLQENEHNQRLAAAEVGPVGLGISFDQAQGAQAGSSTTVGAQRATSEISSESGDQAELEIEQTSRLESNTN